MELFVIGSRRHFRSSERKAKHSQNSGLNPDEIFKAPDRIRMKSSVIPEMSTSLTLNDDFFQEQL